MRFNLNLVASVLLAGSAFGAIPAQNQSLTVASGLPCRDGLVLWLAPWSGLWSDAGLTPATLAGTNKLYQWNDISGNTNHFIQSTANVRPFVDSNGAVEFPYNVNSWMQNSSLPFDKQSYTLLILARSISVGNGVGCVVSANGQTPSIFTALDVGALPFAWIDSYTGLTYHTNIAPVASMTFGLLGNASNTGFLVESTVNIAAAGPGLVTGAQLGRFFNSSYNFVGQLSQVLAWNRRLSASEISAVSQWISGIQPYYPTYTRRVAAVGDSLTMGFKATDVQSYPYQLQLLEGSKSRVFNYGNYGATIAGLLNPDAAKAGGITNICLVWAGVNNLSNGDDGGTCYTNLLAYTNSRKSAGWNPIVMTIIDANFVGSPETQRLAYNSLILANQTNFSSVIDLASDSRFNHTNTVYYSNDGEHLTSAGYGVVASLVHAGLP